MLAPVTLKKVRKVIKRHRRLLNEPCPRSRLLRKLIAEAPKGVAILRPTPEEMARNALVNAGVAYCLAKCGGCALTDAWSAPQ
jgi:hypothetical protein